MGRRAKGSVEWRGDHWAVRVTLKKSRPWIHLDATEPPLTELAAQREGERIARRMREGDAQRSAPSANAASVAAGERVDEYDVRWCTSRRAAGHTSVVSDESRLNNHVHPLLGARPIAAVTRDETEALVASLDSKVVAGALHWRTAIAVWALVRKLFGDACAHKSKALRVRADDPTEGVKGPDRGVMRAKSFLYPSEFLALITCPSIPLVTRRIYALSTYLATRAGELEALEWGDIDLAHGVVHIHRSINRDPLTGALLKSTKTGTPRRFRVESELLPLLHALHTEATAATGGNPIGRVVAVANPFELAETLRLHLGLAGVARAELFIRDATRKQITFHDLRATSLTWMAVREDAPQVIQHRAGHADYTTTQGYIRAAEILAEGFGVVFPVLPIELLGSTPAVASPPPPVPSPLAPESSGLRHAPSPPIAQPPSPQAFPPSQEMAMESEREEAAPAIPRDLSDIVQPSVAVAATDGTPEGGADAIQAIRAEPPRATEAPTLTPRAELLRALGRAMARCVEDGDDDAAAMVADTIARFRTLPPVPGVGRRDASETGT